MNEAESRPPSVDATAAVRNRTRPLDRVHVVLVQPKGPRNVGAVARAMANFGLGKLRLFGGVPKLHPEALDYAVTAKGLLEEASQVPTLDEALHGLTFILASTAKRRERTPTLRPREAAARILEEAARGQVGIVFGREDHGLTSEEIGHAHAVLAIETAPECRALNLSHAFTILAYELYLASGERGLVAHSDSGRLIPHEVRQRLASDLGTALAALQVLKPGNEHQIRQSLDRILALGPMQTRDARILFTLARKVKELADGTLPATPDLEAFGDEAEPGERGEPRS